MGLGDMHLLWVFVHGAATFKREKTKLMLF